VVLPPTLDHFLLESPGFGGIMSHLELRADRRGANLYGPEQMEAALKKMVAHSTNPLAIAAVLGRIPQGDPRKEILRR
jgi:hypothetical protein